MGFKTDDILDVLYLEYCARGVVETLEFIFQLAGVNIASPDLYLTWC